jgi:DNA-binding NarL/FixJ family response regulator
MDMSMPKLNGVEATRAIHNHSADIRIIGLSMFEEADRAVAMRDAGAVAYLTKSGPSADLIAAIRACISGPGEPGRAASPRPRPARLTPAARPRRRRRA